MHLLLLGALSSPAHAELCQVPGLQPELHEVAGHVAVDLARELALDVAAETASEEEGGWWTFVLSATSNLSYSGMLDRYLEVERVIERVESGVKPSELGIAAGDYRLRNVAEMSDVIRSLPAGVDRPAAYSLRDANSWFYVLFGNNGGSFQGMDMQRYREIGAMSGSDAAEVLPQFEADLFARQTDPATVAFGNSLPAAERLDLFLFHNSLFSPSADGG